MSFDKLNSVNFCEVCNHNKLNEVLDLGNHPLCDDLIPVGDSRKCKEYPIKIAFCENCFTAHQLYQVPKRLLFSDSYHYRARMTGSVLDGMNDLVSSCEKFFGDLSKKKVLDIGCNDGSLLDFFRNKGCLTLGVEPTRAALESKHDTINSFFDYRIANKIKEEFGYPDIITFTNVFAHIENLGELLKSLKLIIKKETKLVIENHYLGAVLKTGQFDTFYHEHPRTYSFRSFSYVAKRLNLSVENVQFVSRYGGNIRVFIGNQYNSDIKVDETGFSPEFEKMSNEIKSWVGLTKNLINELVKKYGPLRAKAFPGRAAILIKLLNLSEKHISAVYEIKGSIKTHHYVPSTRIPILPEEHLYAEHDLNLPIINLAWHIPSEVRANLNQNNYTGEVIDIRKIK